MCKISKDYIKSWLWYRFNEKETYRTLLHRGDKFYRGDCKDWHLHVNKHHRAKQGSELGKDWHMHGTQHHRAKQDSALSKY